MAQGNGHDQSHRNRYDKPNRYASEREHTSTNAPPAAAPGIVLKPAADEFQPRNLPTAALYNPALGGRRRDLRAAQEHIRGLQIAGEVAGAAETLEGRLTTLEEAHQRRELVQLRRGQLPAKLEMENLKLGDELLQARTAFEAAVERQRSAHIDRARDRQIDDEDFETLMATRRAARLEAQARALAAEQSLAHAAETGRRKAEADLHMANEAAYEKEADAETQRRRRDQERHRRSQASPPEGPDMPAPLAAHYATEQRVKDSRRRAEELAAEIRHHAAAAGRELTDDEVEEIDALLNAAAGAEDTIRRGDATDFKV